MKKSLIIRWIIVAAVVISCTVAMFPIKDKNYLETFRKASRKQVEALELGAAELEKLGNPDELKAKMDAVEDKSSDEFKALQESYTTLRNSEYYAKWVKAKDYKVLWERIEAIRAKEPNLSGFMVLDRASKGDSDTYRIALSDYVKVPFHRAPSNKLVLRYLRKESAGKLHLGLDLQGGTEFVLGFDEAKVPKGETVEGIRDRILEILRNRLNVMGVTEPELKATGDSTISVRMPSVDEADKTDIRNTIKQAAKLEFHLVPRNNSELVSQYLSDPQHFRTPADLVRKEIENERNGEVTNEVIFINKQAERVRGEDVEKAFPNVDEFGNWTISLVFSGRGSTAFAEVTGNNVGRRLAIVLDGVVYSAPNIQTAITGGHAEITGSFTLEEARRLAGVIASGNVPVSVEIDSEFGTDPTLGADSIRSGIYAGLLGLAIVVVFMTWYYKFAGIVAVLALIVNTVMVLGAMALTKATITMPGVAGMVLTIGMAVDANVLIFERIREELNTGKVLGNAIAAGYARAFSSIFDSNLTTLVTAFFMYKYGSGSVKGFAVTLAFGIFASMFTAIFMTHAIFDLAVMKGFLKQLDMRMFNFLKGLHVEFLSYRKTALKVSIALVALSLIVACVRGRGMFGIDFSGGTELSYSCDGQAPDVEAVRDFLKSKNYANDLRVGYKRGQDGDRKLEIVLPLTKGTEGTEELDYTAFNDELDKAFPEVKIRLLQTNTVGGNVGSQFRKDALIAVILSTIGIIIYLAFRFEFMYGLGAVVAVLHDIIICGGLYLLCGGHLSLTGMAALLTIFGYSLNDTVVIFDRIREMIVLKPGAKFYDIINDALSSTVARTLLTSLTTMLAVLSLLVFGGGAIFEFALIMFFGVIVGTYSSVFVASSFINTWSKRAAKATATREVAK